MMSGKCGGCAGHKLAGLLVIIGGLNWGLLGLGWLLGYPNWNVVNMLLGSWPMVEGIVYLLVGLSALVMIFGCKCKKCKAMAGGSCKSGSCSGGSCKSA